MTLHETQEQLDRLEQNTKYAIYQIEQLINLLTEQEGEQENDQNKKQQITERE